MDGVVVVHTINPRTREAEADGSLSSSLAWSNSVSSRIARATQRNPVLEEKKKKKKKQKTKKQNLNEEEI